nr:hypothetical protein Itr_chr10CG12340 [Ipomoea trifida]
MPSVTGGQSQLAGLVSEMYRRRSVMAASLRASPNWWRLSRLSLTLLKLVRVVPTTWATSSLLLQQNKKKRIQEQHKRIAARLVGQPLERGTTGTAGSFSLDHSIRRRLRVRRNFFAEVNLLRCCFRSQEVTEALFTIRRRTCRVKKKAVDAAQPLAGDRRSCCVYWSSSPEAARNRCSTANTGALSVADCRRSQIPTAGVHFFVAVGSYRRGSAPPVDVSGDKLKFATQP